MTWAHNLYQWIPHNQVYTDMTNWMTQTLNRN